ncbi:MAG: hypothetical protein M1571_06300 [Firmicutes bacterium]|nr:hypothetical protein [Bacillota bacterium]
MAWAPHLAGSRRDDYDGGRCEGRGGALWAKREDYLPLVRRVRYNEAKGGDERMSGETQRAETARAPEYTLASPEFFHLLHRVEQTETTLRQEIKQLEVVMRQEIARLEAELKRVETELLQEIKRVEIGLRQEIKQELAGVRTLIWATLALVVTTAGLTIAVMLR